MPVTVVIGGQFGSEGKGKVSHFLAQETRVAFAVRVGGPNSGHTVIDPFGKPIIFRHLPTPCILPDVVSVIPPGSYLHIDTLLGEIRQVGLPSERLAIDPHAWIISSLDEKAEADGGLKGAIGSTGAGVGASLLRRIGRAGPSTFAKDIPELMPFLKDTGEILGLALKNRQRVLVEGTQGFGLSVLHSPHYPYCTSRDTTASAFVSEAGLSPMDVDEVVLVLRTFPIRVGGASGPLPNEIDWATVTAESGYPRNLIEFTSVTKRVRRVARFDPEIVRRAILHNRPTCIALNHLDYVDAQCTKGNRLTQRSREFVQKTESLIGSRISLLGFDRDSLAWRDLKARKVAHHGS